MAAVVLWFLLVNNGAIEVRRYEFGTFLECEQHLAELASQSMISIGKCEVNKDA